MNEAKHTEKMLDSATAHIFPDDLERLQSSECTATVCSIPASSLDRGETVPLFSADSHYALVEALEELTEALNNVHVSALDHELEQLSYADSKARAAIKQAKGES